MRDAVEIVRESAMPNCETSHETPLARMRVLTVGSVLLCGLLVAGLNGQAVGRRGSAESDQKSAAAKDAATAGSGEQGACRVGLLRVCVKESVKTGVYRTDFRHKQFDHSTLVPFGFKTLYGLQLLKPEPRGLRIAIPNHQGAGKPSIGFLPLRKIHGDFEIAASYELLPTEPPKTGAGAGANLYILAEETFHSASFRRCVTPDGDDAFFVHVSTRNKKGKLRPQYNYFPAETKSGRLCLKRTGSTLQFLVVEGEGDKRRKLHEVEFGTSTIGLLRVATTTDGSPTTTENLWKDFSIQATRLEPVDIPVYRNRQFEVRSLTPAERASGCSATLKPAESTARAPDAEPTVRFFDGFDGKFKLNWEPVRPDPTHMSLTKNPGKLTITTQYGGIYGGVGPSAKNFFLIRNPVADGGDFVLTTCIESFRPTMHWQQAGLLVYDDDDNYLKCDIERGKTDVRFACIRETAGEPISEIDWPGVEADRVWIRVTKRGKTYERAYSTDGREFLSGGPVDWGNGAPKWIGIVAKNGPSGADEIDATFDFFEIRSLTPAEKARSTGLRED